MYIPIRALPAGVTIVMWLSSGDAIAAAAEGFEVFEPFIETNASAGDVGFHYLVDGGAWRSAQMFDPDGRRLMSLRTSGDLARQGLTELFNESAEPPCSTASGESPDDVVTVEEFLERFEEGTYRIRGVALEGGAIGIEGELTHELPAAPRTAVVVDGDTVTIRWEPGTDLGVCDVPDDIPNPATVPVVRWEVAVEPNADAFPGGELPDGVPSAALNLQLPAESRSIQIPAEYIESYRALGVEEFKGEVGAREVGGNQTFTEFEFSVEP